MENMCLGVERLRGSCGEGSQPLVGNDLERVGWMGTEDGFRRGVRHRHAPHSYWEGSPLGFVFVFFHTFLVGLLLVDRIYLYGSYIYLVTND